MLPRLPDSECTVSQRRRPEPGYVTLAVVAHYRWPCIIITQVFTARVDGWQKYGRVHGSSVYGALKTAVHATTNCDQRSSSLSDQYSFANVHWHCLRSLQLPDSFIITLESHSHLQLHCGSKKRANFGGLKLRPSSVDFNNFLASCLLTIIKVVWW